MEQPAISIDAATQIDINQMDAITGVTTYSDGSKSTAGHVLDGAAAVRFYGKLVAICDEYGTATTIDGIDKEGIEKLLIEAVEIWPRRYMQDGVRVCHRCNYREDNHAHNSACAEFVPVPEHLRF